MADNKWIIFVVGTILSWGCYIPALHTGQKILGGGSPSAGGLRAFVCVGGAYFLTAFLIPMIILYTSNLEDTSFDFKGSGIAFLAGILGALGAIGIILAIKFGGKPSVIPSLIFCGAPIVNVFVALGIQYMQEGNIPKAHPVFYVGIVLAAVGAGLVLYGKPAAPKPAAKSPDTVQTDTQPQSAT